MLAQEQCAALIESMFGVTTSDDYRPVAWMGRYPVDVTTMLVGLHVAAAILTAILVAIGGGAILAYLQFDSAAVWSGQVWRLFTYAFVHPPSGLLWFAIEMYMLFVFGREVERFIGRRAYIAPVSYFACYACGAANDLGSLATFGSRRFARTALRNFCCLRRQSIRGLNCSCGS